MPSKPLSSFSGEEIFLRLPHPYLVNYSLHPGTSSHQSSRASRPPAVPGQTEEQYFSLRPHEKHPIQSGGRIPPFPLHRPDINFSTPLDPATSSRPAESNNTAWGRARRSPAVSIVWGFEGCPGGEPARPDEERRDEPPSLAQLWLLVYALFTHRPQVEAFRLRLLGPGLEKAKRVLLDCLLAVPHPKPTAAPGRATPSAAAGQEEEVLILRASFWQGAGSPFGSRPAWIPSSPTDVAASQPPLPLVHTLAYSPDADTASRPVRHPIRPGKPTPGSVVYSRWIPHLGETFSMVALNLDNKNHLDLFHTWQNDPRVSAGWNESGSLEHHRNYLQRLWDDPSQLPLLACWDDEPFAYFEVYWAAEDRLGAYYGNSSVKDFDRGRHSLVGEIRFRGPHRVSAWWGSLVHYLFLDEARTMRVVGEPKASNATVLTYDFMAGFGMLGFAELPHKRSAMVGLSRERFFEICPLGDGSEGYGIEGENGMLKVVGGTGVGLMPKL